MLVVPRNAMSITQNHIPTRLVVHGAIIIRSHLRYLTCTSHVWHDASLSIIEVMCIDRTYYGVSYGVSHTYTHILVHTYIHTYTHALTAVSVVS